MVTGQGEGIRKGKKKGTEESVRRGKKSGKNEETYRPCAGNRLAEARKGRLVKEMSP